MLDVFRKTWSRALLVGCLILAVAVPLSGTANAREGGHHSASRQGSVSGVVTDASGHGWPMRAKITVEGHSDEPVFSSPFTGHYSLQLPPGEYTLHVTSADLPGYQSQEVPIQVGDSGNLDQDIAMHVRDSTCSAPGYAYRYTGMHTGFEGWHGTTPQDGWTIVDNLDNGQTWAFDDPGHRGNATGGSGGFAVVDSAHYGYDGHQDTSLVTPIVDLSTVTAPTIAFDTYKYDASNAVAQVGLSIDGGDTWTTVWQTASHGAEGRVVVPIPAAAGESDVQVRFHYTGGRAFWWELDNVVVGLRNCAPSHGGLVAGVVSDANTGEPVIAATVARTDDAAVSGASSPTPKDANLPDGYYWLFSPKTGPTAFTASKGRYPAAHHTVDVPADYVRHTDWSLRAGHLTVDTDRIRVLEHLGQVAYREVTFGNDGSEPVHVRLSEIDRGVAPMHARSMSASPGAPTMRVTTPVSIGSKPFGAARSHRAREGRTVTVNDQQVRLRQPSPAAGPWTAVADYPMPVMDNAVAYHDGLVYSVGGVGRWLYATNAAYVYDPSAQAWHSIPDLPQALQRPVAEFIGKKLYVVGGWTSTWNELSTHTFIYDPATRSWSRGADMPIGVSAAGSTVVNGELYVVGGCTSSRCRPGTQAVYSYDPDSDAWTRHADYPKRVAWLACAGITGQVVCAGGADPTTSHSLSSTYSYDPDKDRWTQRADMPYANWGMASAEAHNKLQVVGGVLGNHPGATNRAAEYDLETDSWSPLPNANNAVIRGGGACGLYVVGGSTGGFNPVPFAEVLPGYHSCGGGSDVAWISTNTDEFDVAPGESITIRIGLDSSAVSQPGGYDARVAIADDSPYSPSPVEVRMQVKPPQSWGKLAGTVTDASGDPIGGATVQVCTMWDRWMGCGPVTYTLKTDAEGHYQLWLNAGYSPLSIIAVKDGYQPQRKLSDVHRGQTTHVDFVLQQ